MGINKVVYGDRTLMDISEDTVSPETLLAGETAHDATGAPIVGTNPGGGYVVSMVAPEEMSNISSNNYAVGKQFIYDKKLYTAVSAISVGDQILSNENLFNTSISTVTINGVTFTVNSDGSITLSGTATDDIALDLGSVDLLAGDFVLSSGLTGERTGLLLQIIDSNETVIADDVSSPEFTLLSDSTVTLTLSVAQGNSYSQTLIPCVSNADPNCVVSKYLVDQIEDAARSDNFVGTFEQWSLLTPEQQANYLTLDITDDYNGMPVDSELDVESSNPIQNQAVANPIEAIVNVYGSKNLCKYPYASTTKEYAGITWTDNGDGSITVSGTASADSPFNMWAGTLGFVLPQGDYILSGCPENGSESTYYFYLSDGNTGHIIEGVYDTGDGVSFTVPQDNLELLVRLVVKSGTVISTPITFRPMIRDSRITDPTYVPYAMTNKELTNRIASVEYNIPNDTNTHTFYYPTGYTINNCVLISAKCYTVYDSWVNCSYNNNSYFGDFKYQSNYFEYAANTAGKSSRIVFTFAKIL